MIYLAYGSNLNKAQMRVRCPDATPKGYILLPDYRLVFKGVADMIPAKGLHCPVGLWEITDKCEKALDRYEGFPRLYRKEYFVNKDGIDFMAYVMNGYGLGMPPETYYKAIAQGYNDFGIDTEYLESALEFTREYDSNDGYVSQGWKQRYTI
jgi:hypothetical protein